jgi:peptide/nickel transport system substrate-binding protein
MHGLKQFVVAGTAIASLTLAIAACGSSDSNGNTTRYTPLGVPISGPGLTSPTAPHGTKLSGGTVYFTEVAQTPPNYIFPMFSSAYCGYTSLQLTYLLFRPLYWYGNNYTPTIDYSYSVGQKPQVSSDNRTYTIHLRPWSWSDGERVTSRDLVFWMNLLKASPATEWCGYVPGYFPDDVASFSAPNPSTFVITFKRAYDPEWVIYNELSQLFPLPLAWDRTSFRQPAPTSDNGHLPDTTTAGATAVYKFLDAQSKATGSWASSPLWSVVDGPFKLQSFSSSGEVTIVPNRHYSGAPKPTIAKLVELPFTSEAAIFNEMRSVGPSGITIGTVPPQYAPQVRTLAKEGFVINKAASYGYSYFPMNFNSNAPEPGGGKFGYLVRQLYFRQAIQRLVDQTGWIHAFLDNTADPTYTSIPLAPPSPLVDSNAIATNPYPFSVAAAKQLLASHGWKVVPGGTTTCQDPALCGLGIKKGESISFNLDYESGVVTLADEMNDLAAQANKVGIHIDLTTHPFNDVITTSAPCTMSQSSCNWTAANWGSPSWIYVLDYLPTGESLYNLGSAANNGNYSDPTTTTLISRSITGPLSQERAALTAFAKNVARMLPVVFAPSSIGTYSAGAGVVIDKHLGGYAANADGLMNPEDWYFVK